MLVEVKPGKCAFNGPWTNREAGNLQEVLRAVGSIAPNKVGPAADEIYARGRYSSSEQHILLIAVGNQVDRTLAERLPGAKQITWDECLRFIMDRFIIYHNQKAHHPQWDAAGKELFDLAALAHQDVARFTAAACQTFSIEQPPANQHP